MSTLISYLYNYCLTAVFISTDSAWKNIGCDAISRIKKKSKNYDRRRIATLTLCNNPANSITDDNWSCKLIPLTFLLFIKPEVVQKHVLETQRKMLVKMGLEPSQIDAMLQRMTSSYSVAQTQPVSITVAKDEKQQQQHHEVSREGKVWGNMVYQLWIVFEYSNRMSNERCGLIWQSGLPTFLWTSGKCCEGQSYVAVIGGRL